MSQPRHHAGVTDEDLAAVYEPGLGLSAAAARFESVTEGDVRTAMRRLGKPLRTREQALEKLAARDRSWRGRYEAGESIPSIARSSGMSCTAVRLGVQRQGGTIRDPGKAARNRAVWLTAGTQVRPGVLAAAGGCGGGGG